MFKKCQQNVKNIFKISQMVPKSQRGARYMSKMSRQNIKKCLTEYETKKNMKYVKKMPDMRKSREDI